jgi:hypothetical protein
VKQIRILFCFTLTLAAAPAYAQTPVFPQAQISAILEQTARDCTRQWGNAHREGHPERYDYIIEAVKRLYLASGGTVGGNWRRVVIGDLSMDGLTIDMREPNGTIQRYFADVIAGAGGPNPRLVFNVTGLLRDSAGRYAPEGFAAPNHPRFPAAVVGCGGTPTIPPIDPPTCPVCPPVKPIPPYPGDRPFDVLGAQLEADYKAAGQALNAQSATWFARSIYDYFAGGLTIEQSIAKHRDSPGGWRDVLGLPRQPSAHPPPASALADDRPLPPWDDTMSDGCSATALLKHLFETPLVRAACVHHDRAYYFGGSREDRLRADYQLGVDWIRAGLTVTEVESGIAAIRVGGEPWYRVKGVSWAFGGERFRYSERIQ